MDELITTILDAVALVWLAAGVGLVVAGESKGWGLVAAGVVLGAGSFLYAQPWKRTGGDGS